MKSNYLRRMSDSDGKGVLGCILMIFLTGVAIYLGIVLAPIYYSNFNFESAVKTEITKAGAHFLDDETIVKDILDFARRNEIRLTRENIAIDRFAGQVHVNVHYSVPVDLGPIEHNLSFQISASSFIGTL